MQSFTSTNHLHSAPRQPLAIQREHEHQPNVSKKKQLKRSHQRWAVMGVRDGFMCSICRFTEGVVFQTLEEIRSGFAAEFELSSACQAWSDVVTSGDHVCRGFQKNRNRNPAEVFTPLKLFYVLLPSGFCWNFTRNTNTCCRIVANWSKSKSWFSIFWVN